MRDGAIPRDVAPMPTRRAVVAGMATGAMATMPGPAGPARAQANAKTFVLVHGASQGGWCWRRVSDRLERRGHKVFTPTLTGLGERSHLMGADVNLDMHITDVVNVIKWESLQGIVLVGHSYGGWVVSGVAEQMLPAISAIVFLDAFMPENGQKGLDLNSERSKAEIAGALQKGDVSRPPPPATTWNVNEKDRAWVDAKQTAQPIGVSLQPIRLTGARERVGKKTYIRATDYANPNFDRFYAKTKADPSWRTYAVHCGHDVMIDMPDRLVEILEEVA
jgi:pimeloyl-ACP methyl ester carboxylesterase